MRKLVFAALAGIVMATPIGFGATSAVAGGGTPHCPPNTTLILDEVTGMKVCKHEHVELAGGHPAYDKKAPCTPGEKRTFRVKIPNGYRIVEQTCTNNF